MNSTENTLLRKMLGNKEYLTVFDVPKVEAFGNKFFHDTKRLYRAYETLISGDVSEENKQTDDCILFEQKGNKNWILGVSDNDGIELPFLEMKDLLSSLMDIQEKILPLGTVIDLNKDFITKNIPQIEALDHFRVVITHRFLSYLESVFYPYAGVLYPTGMLGRPEFIYFTYSMIEDVVQEGFSDVLEQEYVNAMKSELLAEKQMHSAGFATEEEIDKLARILEGRNE